MPDESSLAEEILHETCKHSLFDLDTTAVIGIVNHALLRTKTIIKVSIKMIDSRILCIIKAIPLTSII